jgi:hypothetical protein
MSHMLTGEDRISVKPFARVPALLDLPAIQRTPASVSNVSSSRESTGGVDLAEGCLITKAIKYTHQLVHWVNAVRNESEDCHLIVSSRLMDGHWQ